MWMADTKLTAVKQTSRPALLMVLNGHRNNISLSGKALPRFDSTDRLVNKQ
jgi:hypothetical protein